MSTFDKFIKVIKSNLNALIDKAEDPQKMLNQAIFDLKEKERQVKKMLISLMADLKLSKKAADLKKIAENEKTIEILVKGLKAIDEKIQSLKNYTAKNIINKSDSFDTFTRMENKISQVEAENEALNELINIEKSKEASIDKDIEELENELEKLNDKK